jgi:hypothetical protein
MNSPRVLRDILWREIDNLRAAYRDAVQLGMLKGR